MIQIDIDNLKTNSKKKENKILRGFMAGFLIGLISFFSISLARDNLLLNFVAQILVPFTVTYMLTRNWLTTFTLITITDIFLSFTSLYFNSIGLSGSRGIMFMITMSIYIMYVYQQSIRKTTEHPWTFLPMSVMVFFYGLVLPLLLVLYSVFIAGTSVGTALGDVQFIFPLLLYFPISRLLKKNSGYFLGWVLAISIIHVTISLTLSIGPFDITSIMYQNYSNSLSEEAVAESYEGLVALRTASPVFIASYVGFFTSFLILADSSKKMIFRICGAGVSLFCLSHLVFDYMRGPLIASVLILLLFGFAAALKRHFHSFAFRTFLFIFTVVLISGYAMYRIVPEGLLRFIISSGGFQEFEGPERAEQSVRLLEAFKEEPILGQGVGVPIKGYARSANGLDFELQYQMFLYKVGIVGFLILMAPIIWLIAELFRKKGAMSKRLFRIEGKFHMSLLLSILATSVAAYGNPYLKTGFMTLTIAMYLSYRKAIQHQLIVK